MPAKGSIKPQSSKFLTKEQVAELLRAPLAEGESRDHYVLSCLYYLALRDVEVVSLRGDHFVHLDRGSMLIPTAKRRRHRCSRACAKPCEMAGVWDRRKHRIVDTIADRPLVEFGVIGGEETLRAVQAWSAGRTWVFPAGKGEGHMSTRTVQRIFRRWADATGLDPTTTSHTLRHTACSILIDMPGVKPQMVRDFARHSNISVTDIYIHTTKDAWKSVAGALSLDAPRPT